jgi:hypothetical protein
MLMENLRFILYTTVGDVLLWLFLDQMSPVNPHEVRFIVVVVYALMLGSSLMCSLMIGLFRKK